MAYESQTESPKKSNGNQRRGLLQIATQVSASLGTEFLESLARNLAEALTADCVYTGEFAGGQVERLRILALFADGKLGSQSDHALTGTLAAQVAASEPCVCTRGIQKRFPDDPLLLELGAQAGVAVPLLDSKRQVLGALVALYRNPIANPRLPKSTLEMFSPRASAELHRKQMDDALRESEQRYRVFIAQNADAMWRIEFETPIATDLPEDEQIEQIYRYGYLAECNDALARLMGHERADQLIGATFEQLAQRADSHLREDVRSAIHSGYRFMTVEAEPVDHAGKRRSLLRSQWGVVENGMLRRIWGTHRDLTDLRRAETAARVSEERLSELLEGAHLVSVMLDSHNAITFCNESLLSLAGWREEDVVGKNWFDLAVPPPERERVRAAFAATQLNAPAPHYFESSLLGADGNRRLIGWKTTALRDFDGQISGIAGVGRDLTTYKAMEASAQQAQKLDHIGRTVGRIAQDFSNVLGNITRNCANLIPSGQGSDSPALLEIKAEAERGADLVQQLLAFGRRQQFNPLLLNVNRLAEDCERTLGPLLPANVKLELDLDSSLGFVRADSSQLQQALLNLALNARDAMPNGGNLTIASSNVTLNENRALALAKVPPGDYVRLSVRDTGAGISEEAKAHLFEPFYTTKEQRAGLGLAAVYGIIQQSGGHIVVETELRAGTTFQIYLPRVRPQL
jgi:hypothetical protein